jgi:hypothetical protein
VINPHKGYRESPHTFEYYRMFFDKYLKEQKLPHRGHSLIYTNHYSIAEAYGRVYVIFPYNNTILGRVNKEDMWYHDIKINDVPFNVKILNDLYHILGLPDDSYTGFCKGILPMIDHIDDYEDRERLYDLLAAFKKSNPKTPDDIDKILRKSYNI